MLEHLLYISLLILLVGATITDLRYRLIYDRFVLSGIAITVIIRIFHQPEPWYFYVGTGITSFLLLTTLAIWTNERSIGMGDVKLFGMLGLALGFEPFMVLFFSSHLLAAIYIGVILLIQRKEVNRKTEFPFAPFILLGTGISYLLYA